MPALWPQFVIKKKKKTTTTTIKNPEEKQKCDQIQFLKAAWKAETYFEGALMSKSPNIALTPFSYFFKL